MEPVAKKLKLSLSANPTRFLGKRALVTGAGKGIGREIVLYLASQGATVIALSRTQQDLDELRKMVPKLEIIIADVADANSAKRAAEQAGDVDLLVNSAGIALLEPFLETSVDKFDLTMNVNVRAAMIISQVVAKNMIKRKSGGSIVNISSQAGEVGFRDHTSYCVSKGALDQLTRTMCLELATYGIRVNSVQPTVVLTPMGEMAWSDPAKAGPMLSRIPMRRFAEPIEVATVVGFLLSDEASMVNGAMLPIDGGFLAT